MSLVNHYPTVFPFSPLLVISVSIREEGITAFKNGSTGNVTTTSRFTKMFCRN